MKSQHLSKDIMATKLVELAPDTHVFDGIRLLLKHRITGAPVVGSDHKYLGVFSEKCSMGVLTLIARLAAEGGGETLQTPLARDFMATDLVTVSPHTDVFEAIGFLLKHSISGAPVVDPEGAFLGIFSEKSSMRVLIDAAYEQLPSTEVGSFADTTFERVISEETDLLSCAQIFIDTPYRRLPVLRGGKVVGQVSRRDVLANAQVFSASVTDRDRMLLQHSDAIDRSDGDPEQAHGRLPSTEVEHFMDVNARTIGEEVDVLSMVQIFLTTPYRRLPVLRGPQLVGQVSRRDLLRAIHNMLKVVPPRERNILYLSSLLDRDQAPIE
jgi:CBS domain-containing protein